RLMNLAANPSNGISAYTGTATNISIIRKLVPQRGWKVVNRCARSTVTGSPDSKLKTTLCSAPWYSKTRRMSLKRDTRYRNATSIDTRMIPSARLNGIRPVSIGYTLPSLVASTSGMNLYRKIMKATENSRFAVTTQPGNSLAGFLSGAAGSMSATNWSVENLSAP